MFAGTGLGAALYATLFRHLARLPDVDTLMGYVDADNVPSLRLTERLGLRGHASDLMFQAGEPR
jgi:mycothiol synthase